MLDRRSLLASLAATPLLSEKRLFSDDFRQGLGQWVIEAEKPASVTAQNGVLDIVTPAGLTAWFKRELTDPVAITYQAMAVSEGGPYDRVSDLNAFWMAREVGGGSPLKHRRSGAFADYDTLETYYVGQGGNGNTSTRSRRDADAEPLDVGAARRRRFAHRILVRRPATVRPRRSGALPSRLVWPADHAEPSAHPRLCGYPPRSLTTHANRKSRRGAEVPGRLLSGREKQRTRERGARRAPLPVAP